MPHPNRMIPDRELNNFRIFLKANPHLTNYGSEGAFDAKPSGSKNIRFNKEKRFTVALDEFSRGGAFDAEAEESSQPQNGLTLDGLKRLARKLSPEGWAALHEALNEDPETEGAEDEPPDFLGKPEVGKGPPAMDSAAANRFAERYPDIASVKANTIGQQPVPKPMRVTTKAAESFNALFPEAAHIKTR